MAERSPPMEDGAPAPPGRRLAFALTLGWFSFAFAELSCGSTPSLFYPAFEFSWSLAITWPLYMSHCVLILTALVRARRACGWTTVPPVCMWLGGQLFGLYESWITKVLFRPTFPGFPTCGVASVDDGGGGGIDGSASKDPPAASGTMDFHNATILAAYCDGLANRTDWGPLPGVPVHEDPACGLYLGGIAAPQFATLVFYYHPTWSFIVPCLVCERLFCRTSAAAGGRYVTVPGSVLPGCLRRFQRCGRTCVKSCCQSGCSCSCCCPWALAVGGFLFGLLLVLAKFAQTKVDDYIIAGLLGALLLALVAVGVVALLSSEEKWRTVLVLFGIYTGLSAVSDELLQAATTAPTAALISIWLIQRGRRQQAPEDEDAAATTGAAPASANAAGSTGVGAAYTLEQMLPRGRELIAWGGVLGGIYVFAGLGLSTQCLPTFQGGPAAILLCYLLLFVLLLLHLQRAPDRCDDCSGGGDGGDEHDGVGSSYSSSGDRRSNSSSINTPILQDSADSTPPAGAIAASRGESGEAEDEEASPSSSSSSLLLPEIGMGWERWVGIAAALSAATTVLTKFVPVVGAIGSTVVILVIDWSGVLLGLIYFITKALAGGVPLLLESGGGGGGGGGSAVGIVAALFGAILVPALVANGVVELVPGLRTLSIAPAAMIGSVLLAVVLTVIGCCVGCRRTCRCR